MEFIASLKERNAILLWFGAINLAAAVVLVFFSFLKPIEFGGTNAWYKPIKFTLSTAILSFSIAWYTGYLTMSRDIHLINWIIVITLAFEIIYITWQAARGQASHFNISTPFYSFMYSMMALAATAVTLAIGYLGIKFFTTPLNDLPHYYVWAIRFGFVLFFIFSFQGFIMGARMAHTVGANDGVKGIPFLNWSVSYGDLRIAHFIGMHALQVLPLLAWYVLRNTTLTVLVSVIYALLAVFILVVALKGNSIVGRWY